MLRLLSWNVQWCRGMDGVVDPFRIAAEARRLADPDVACLQEVAAGFPELPGSRGEDQTEALQRAFAYPHAHFGWGVDLPGEARSRKRFGNLVLARIAVDRVLRHSLPWPPSPDTPSMPRVAVEAEVAGLRVVTTHLEYYSQGQREAQVDALRAVHLQACRGAHLDPEPGPFQSLPRPKSALLCGDFNFPPENPLRRRLLAPFEPGVPAFVDAWEALHPGRPHPPSFRLHDRERGESPYCCDYVFVTEDLVPRLRRFEIDAATQASDHQPVILELDA